MLVEANKLVHLVLAEEEEHHQEEEHRVDAPIDQIEQLKGGAGQGQGGVHHHVRHRQRQADEGNVGDGQLKDDQLQVGVGEAVVVDLRGRGNQTIK